jgi:hypothetical protein
MANKRVLVVDELKKIYDNPPVHNKDIVKDLVHAIKHCLTGQSVKLTEYQMSTVVLAIKHQGVINNGSNASFVLQIVTFINSCQIMSVGDFEC